MRVALQDPWHLQNDAVTLCQSGEPEDSHSCRTSKGIVNTGQSAYSCWNNCQLHFPSLPYLLSTSGLGVGLALVRICDDAQCRGQIQLVLLLVADDLP